MEIKLRREYFNGVERERLRTIYSIKAPEGVSELDGYVMKFPEDDVKLTDSHILLFHGNEWNKRKMKYLFMFEKEEKNPGKRYKRYRYTEEELIKLYGQAESKTFNARLAERESRLSGPGKLIRATFSDYKEHCVVKKNDWLIVSDAEQKWCYEFDYDPLRDLGKHNRDAKWFSIQEEYHVTDISILFKNKKRIYELLKQLNRSRKLSLKNPRPEYFFDRYGNFLKTNSTAESITLMILKELIPEELLKTHDYDMQDDRETPEAEEFRTELYEETKKLEIACFEFVEKCRTEQLNAITEEVKEITGIQLKSNRRKSNE